VFFKTQNRLTDRFLLSPLMTASRLASPPNASISTPPSCVLRRWPARKATLAPLHSAAQVILLQGISAMPR
jgi:hypothetical protein